MRQAGVLWRQTASGEKQLAMFWKNAGRDLQTFTRYDGTSENLDGLTGAKRSMQTMSASVNWSMKKPVSRRARMWIGRLASLSYCCLSSSYSFQYSFSSSIFKWLNGHIIWKFETDKFFYTNMFMSGSIVMSPWLLFGSIPRTS